MSKITPHNLWLVHRAILGGVSSTSGTPLPDTIDACPVGPQESHYGLCCFIAMVNGDTDAIPLPPLVAPERAAIIRATSERMGRSVRDLSVMFRAPEVDGDPASCSSCGWIGRCALPLETYPAKGDCPRCGGQAVGDVVS